MPWRHGRPLRATPAAMSRIGGHSHHRRLMPTEIVSSAATTSPRLVVGVWYRGHDGRATFRRNCDAKAAAALTGITSFRRWRWDRDSRGVAMTIIGAMYFASRCDDDYVVRDFAIGRSLRWQAR